MQTTISFFLSFLLVVLAGVDSFVIPGVRLQTLASTLASVPKLSEIDEMCLENVAELCLDESQLNADECDLEDHEALLNQLEAQRNHLAEHMNKIDALMNKLQGEGA